MSSINGLKKQVTIILHSGAYDRVSYALSLAQAALANGMEVHVLLTFEGLRRFTRGKITEIGQETPVSVQADIKRGLEIGALQPLDEQLAEVKKMGLKIYACPSAMACLNIPLRDLLVLDEVMGLVAFLQMAANASVNWYV